MADVTVTLESNDVARVHWSVHLECKDPSEADDEGTKNTTWQFIGDCNSDNNSPLTLGYRLRVWGEEAILSLEADVLLFPQRPSWHFGSSNGLENYECEPLELVPIETAAETTTTTTQ